MGFILRASLVKHLHKM